MKFKLFSHRPVAPGREEHPPYGPGETVEELVSRETGQESGGKGH